MRYLVLSDIHANLEALHAVLADTPAASVDRVLVLGDLVGYGPDPNEVTECIRGLPGAAVIRGNHDKVATGIEAADRFNQVAKQAVEWTTRVLTPENHEYLRSLTRGPLAIDDGIEICHGAPFDEDVYIFDELDVRRAARSTGRHLCLFGHTHITAAFHISGHTLTQVWPRRSSPGDIPFNAEGRWLMNCGAVGQPRDGDWRAAYGIVDTATQTMTMQRAEYDVVGTQAKILKAGLSDALARRLGGGR